MPVDLIGGNPASWCGNCDTPIGVVKGQLALGTKFGTDKTMRCTRIKKDNSRIPVMTGAPSGISVMVVVGDLSSNAMS
jgi:hypothetical protein